MDCASLECVISHLQTDCASLECVISHLQMDCANLERVLSHLQTDCASLECVISHLQTDCASLECVISHLQMDCASLECVTSHLQTDCACLECVTPHQQMAPVAPCSRTPWLLTSVFGFLMLSSCRASFAAPCACSRISSGDRLSGNGSKGVPLYSSHKQHITKQQFFTTKASIIIKRERR